jgi:hypothetical protein
VVLGVRNPHVPSPVDVDVVRTVEQRRPVVSILQSRCAYRTPSKQAHSPVGAYLPDLVVADVGDIDVVGPVAGKTARIVEAGVIATYHAGSVASCDASLARKSRDKTSWSGPDYDMLDGIRAVDVARRIHRHSAEGGASTYETPLPVEEIVLTEDYGTPVETRGVIALFIARKLIETHFSISVNRSVPIIILRSGRSFPSSWRLYGTSGCFMTWLIIPP